MQFTGQRQPQEPGQDSSVMLFNYSGIDQMRAALAGEGKDRSLKDGWINAFYWKESVACRE